MSVPPGRTRSTRPETRDTVRVGDLVVDRAPVTNERYARFLAETGHRPPAFWPNGRMPRSLARHPVVGVDFFDALAFALWAGGSLPSELEWVQATGLREPRAYVWGDTFHSARCNTVSSGVRGTTEVDSYPGGTSPSGCVDLCGNVWELTSSAYPGDPESVIVKGGSWYDYPGHARLDVRFRTRVHRCSKTVGFRLVYGRPVRLPSFLDTALAAECIAYRLAGAPIRTEPRIVVEDHDFFEELRNAAEASLPDLEEDLPGVNALALDEALSLFDATEIRPAAPAPAPRPRRDRRLPRVGAALARRPRLLLSILVAALLAMAGLVTFLVLEGAREGRALREESGVREPTRLGPIARRASPARKSRRDAREPSRPPPNPKRSGPLRDLLEGTPRQREEAERYFVWHPEKARELLDSTEEAAVPEQARASLRYIRAALEERATREDHLPTIVHAPPVEGLVLLVDGLEGRTPEEVAAVRRTARAEGLPLTCVVLGERDVWRFARRHAGVLGAVDLYVDEDGRLARGWGVTRAPAVVGLRRGGDLVFVHLGHISRARLARGVAALLRRQR
jgi:hypothetical protein